MTNVQENHVENEFTEKSVISQFHMGLLICRSVDGILKEKEKDKDKKKEKKKGFF